MIADKAVEDFEVGAFYFVPSCHQSNVWFLDLCWLCFTAWFPRLSKTLFNLLSTLYLALVAMSETQTTFTPPPSRKIIIRPLDGLNQIYENVPANASVRDLKERVFVAEGIPVQNQKLICGPEIMDG